MADSPTPPATNKKRRWYRWLIPRFSLRTLLIAMSLFSLVCGYWIERSERQRQVAEFLTSRQVQWGFGSSPWFKPPKERDQRINHYLYPITSFLYFIHNDPKKDDVDEVIKQIARLPSIEGVKFGMEQRSDIDWRPLAGSSTLTDLEIDLGKVTEQDVKALAAIPRLTRLRLFSFGAIPKDISAFESSTYLEELFIVAIVEDKLEVGSIPSLPRLKRLQLPGVDDRVCHALAGSKTLDWLCLAQGDITDEGLASLRDITTLEYLDITGTCVSDASVDTLATLTHLDTLFAVNGRMTFEGLSRLCERGNVKRISLLYGPENPSFPGIYGRPSEKTPRSGAIPAEVFLGKPLADGSGVTSISFPVANLPKGFFDVLPQLTNLKDLSLHGSNVTDDDLASVAKVNSLTALELNRTTVTGKGLEKLAELPALERLSISEPDEWEPVMEALRRFPALRRLSVGQQHYLSAPDVDAFIGKPLDPSVTAVNLNRLHPTAAARSALAGDTHLKELHLAETGCTDDDLAFLKGYKDIRVLSLAHNRVTDKIAPALESLRTLEALDLSDTDITDATVEVLAKLPSLRLLRLNHTNITDASVELLSANERIEELGLRGTRITDRSIPLLKDLPNLQALNLGPSYSIWLAENEPPQGTISAAAFAQLKEFRALAEVDVVLEELTPERVALLRALPQLQRFTSQGVDVWSESFERIMERKSSKRPARVWYPKNSSERMDVPQHMAKPDELQRREKADANRIRLEGTKDTDEQIEKIVLANAALYLELANTDVTAGGIAKLGELKSLRGLTLEDADFADDVVPLLAGMRGLRYLNLSKMPLTKTSIEQIAKLPLLRSLSVDPSSLAPDEWQALKAKYSFLYDSAAYAGYKRYRSHR